MEIRSLPLLLCGALLLAGCDTTDARIRRKADVFASLAPAEQERLRQGVVSVGDTPDMVYIAIGEPSRRVEKTTDKGVRSQWIYREYYESYDGSLLVGYRRLVGFDRRTGVRYVYLEPVYDELYHEKTEDRLRVVFEEGRVVVIEELQKR